jgi:hypothetical protein
MHDSKEKLIIMYYSTYVDPCQIRLSTQPKTLKKFRFIPRTQQK